MTTLAGRAVLVTGAGFGPGRACAELLAADGARLFLDDPDANRLEATAERLGAFTCPGAGGGTDAVERLVNRALIGAGRLSAAVLAPAVAAGGPVDDAGADGLAEALAAVARAGDDALTAFRGMQAFGTGALVLVHPVPATPTARVVAGAWRALVQELALRCRADGVRVNGVELAVDADPDAAGRTLAWLASPAASALHGQLSTIHADPPKDAP